MIKFYPPYYNILVSFLMKKKEFGLSFKYPPHLCNYFMFNALLFPTHANLSALKNETTRKWQAGKVRQPKMLKASGRLAKYFFCTLINGNNFVARKMLNYV